MIQIGQDFSRFDHLPQQTAWQKRIFAELRFVQTMSNAAEDVYEPLIQKSLQILQNALDTTGVVSNQAAEEAEKELLPAAEEAKTYEFLCPGHAHIDMNWMWGYDETINTVVDTFRTMLQIMREYPDFHFSQSQASVYQILERYAPEMLEEVKERVKEGRWELTTAAWVETDKNMPSGESLSRHVMYAKEYLSKMFSISPDSLEVDFDPDTFGHSMNVPEISEKGGVKYYYHCRGRFGAPVINRWRAPSGAELLMYTEPEWYNGEINHRIAENAVKLAEATGSRTMMKVFGVGDHGGGPTRRDLDTLIEMNGWPVYPKFTFSTFRDYFHTLEARRDTIPVLEGEVNFLCDGCYTTQTRIKEGNRRGERVLHDAELFDALAALRADGKPHPEIFEEAWRKVLFNQFHDIIPGSGVTQTREYASALHQEVIGAAGVRRKEAFCRLADRINTREILAVPADQLFSRAEGGGAGFGGSMGGCGHAIGKSRVYHLFNPSPWERSDLTEIVVWDYEGQAGRLGVQLPDGEWVPAEITEQGGYWGHSFIRMLARVTVPASGWTTVLVTEKPSDYHASSIGFGNDMRVQEVETFVLENQKIRAVFNPATASLCSLYNKETNRELLPEGKEARFELATEAVWKQVTGWNGGMSAWFTGRQKNVVPILEAEMRPLGGGLRKRLEISTSFGTASKLRIEVSLDDNSSSLCYKVGCDWREFGGDQNGIPCLQFTFPTVCADTDTFLYDVPFGFVRRPGMEMDRPADRFVLAEDNTDAVLLSSKSKYGYRTGSGRMAVTLIRAAYDPDPTPETGHHDIEFSLTPTAAGQTNMAYARIIEDYEHPMYAATGQVHDGDLPLSASFVQLVSGQVSLSSVKVSEDKKAVVLRIYETEGKEQSFTVDCGCKPKAVLLADQMERPICDAGTLDGNLLTREIAPYQLMVLRLEF